MGYPLSKIKIYRLCKISIFLQSRKASFLFISNLFFSIYFAQNETMNKFHLFNQGGEKKPTPWEKEERKSGAGEARQDSK